MNPLLENKLNELSNASDYECWYLVKQPTAFDCLCYLVSFLKEYKLHDSTVNLQEYISQKINDLKKEKPNIEISNNYRALRVAAYFGLITMRSTGYVDADITDTYEEIFARCNGNFEMTDLYIDIIQRQIEKMFISSSIDEENNGVRQGYRLYPVMLLYKVLLELGRTTGSYSVSMTEYRYLIATTKKFENFLDTLLLIKLLRKENNDVVDEFEQYRSKFDNRLIQALKQLPTLQIESDSIILNINTISEVAHKVYIFEQNPNNFLSNNYLEFLGSTKSLFTIENSKEQTLTYDDDSKTNELMKLDNREFVFTCLDIMKDNHLFNDVNLEILRNKDKCAQMFKHNAFHGILFRVDPEKNKDDQRKDNSGNIRYYSDEYSINGVNYFVSQEWRPDREDARRPFIDWIFSMMRKIKYKTGYESKRKYSRNRIIFGAPGTGKSFTLNQEKDVLLHDGGEYERVTFHPDYSYASFVGTYKPVPHIDSDGKDAITYKYIPGPFMRVYVNALKNSRTNNPLPHLLIIEEINRANVAAVFGEVFQLLDRNDDFVSEYPVRASEDIKKYLSEELGSSPEDYSEIRIPDNMYIWATMNSADQGVFPLDTAFKRRWSFDYLGINNNESKIEGNFVMLGKGSYRREIEWNELRKAINDTLSSYRINEDKLLGPFFLSTKIVVPSTGNKIDENKFTLAFKSKVIMYLFEDAAKQKRASLFQGCKDTTKYSFICEEFDKRGVEIFCKDISEKFSNILSIAAESKGEY